jgi:hypothetical protein
MTKNIKLLLSCGAVAALGVLAIQGCSSSGDDSSTPSGGSAGTSAGGGSAGKAGGSSAGTSSGGSGTAGKGGATSGGATAGGTGGAAGASTTGEAGESAGGAADEAHPTADECTAFCSLDASTCTGTNAAYTSSDECQTDCLAYPLGDDSDPTRMVAKTGDNFACRAYHLENAVKNAATPALLTLHCGHTAEVSTACF